MLAIVIPYYKIIFFEKCLKSLSDQASKNFHLYIGNDSSQENPEEIINQFRSHLNITYTKFNNNLGRISLVKQWERCIDLVNEEEWIMILGDDDTLEKDCVQNFYDNLEEIIKSNINVIRYSSQVINDAGIAISDVYNHPTVESSTDFLFRRLSGLTRSSLSEYIFNKEQILTKGFEEFPLAWHTDDIAVLEFSNFKNIYSINTSKVFFRNSGYNISSKSDNTIPKNLANFYFYHYLLKEHREEFSQRQINILWTKMEKAFLDDKKQLDLAFKYCTLIFQNLKLVRLIHFSKKYFLAVIK